MVARTDSALPNGGLADVSEAAAPPRPAAAASAKLTGLAKASVWSQITFSWAHPLIRKAHASKNNELEEGDAFFLVPEEDGIHSLARRFDEAYQAAALKHAHDPRHLTARALLSLHWRYIFLECFWCAFEAVLRLASPLLLREFLRFLTSLATDKPQPQWRGWAVAISLGLLGFVISLTHHQIFWVGMRLGQRARQGVVAAVHAKALRLNSAIVAEVSAGKVVNIISNDVRRFDDAAVFYPFLLFGPLELLMVLLMVALELGIWPALAGISATLAIIPLQAALVTYIGGLRRSTATCTDERVRLASEVIAGSLAMKMLSWEGQLSARLCAIRTAESRHLVKMSSIKAVNLAMQFIVTPLAAFITFAVARAINGGFTVPSVFYVLTLLALPRLTLVTYFVLAVQSATELRVSLQRIDGFLSLAEPPAPSHMRQQQRPQAAAAPVAGKKGAAGVVRATSRLQGDSRGSGGGVELRAGPMEGHVALRGSDYDWLRPLAKDPVVAAAAAAAHVAPASPPAPTTYPVVHTTQESSGPQVYLELEPEQGDSPPSGDSGAGGGGGGGAGLAHKAGSLTVPLVDDSEAGLPGAAALRGVVLDLEPGELLGVCGEVGSGKSSLLMALLGELLPRTPETGPLVTGTLAYCSQLPSIVAGTLRENILFGCAYDEEWYKDVLAACALEEDIAGLAAKDLTELGERGINLSGGQKARVALARACYSRASVVLLDDPLSAVDPRVGRVLFERCIGNNGLMRDSTRILVTHQRQFLPMCDRVLVLRNGCAVALGEWDEVSALQLHELVAGMAAVDANGEELGDLSVDDVAEYGPPSPVSVAPMSLPSSPHRAETPWDLRSEVSHVSQSALLRPEHDSDGGSDIAATISGMGGDDAHGALSFEAVSEASLLQQAVMAASPLSAPLRPKHLQLSRFVLSPTRTPRPSLLITPAPAALAALAAAAGAAAAAAAAPAGGGQLVVAEERVMGDVPARVYLDVLRYMGPLVSIIVAAALVAGQAVYLYSQFWLSFWAKAADQKQEKWLLVYGLLTAAVVIISFVRAALFFRSTLRASSRIHDRMTDAVLRAPLAFFHTNPAGRVLNRFSKDLGIVDDLLPNIAFDAMQAGFQCIGAFALIAIAVPEVLPLFIPLLIVFYLYRRQYVRASREVKRWEATTRSPVYTFFSATLKGLPTIRAYGACDRFHAQFLETLSLNGSWNFSGFAAARWIGFRLDVVAACTLMCGCVLSMVMRHSITPSLLGLALSDVLQLTGLLQWFVRQTAEVENGMTSVERMLEYTKLPQEPPSVAAGGAAPPPGWPTSGALRYDRVSAKYRPGLPSVLSDISFELAGGQSCGVVGRTGSGKSSLMLTLFRLIDVHKGSIFLDGHNASMMGLDALRRQLAIIPQDPVLFSGTLRSNLDPWDTQPDARLWAVLEAVRLRPAIEAAGGLHTRMAEAGDNLSVGQRQLFCLARALLQDAVVLALDEATANVDRATDALIQSALRDFAHSEQEVGRRRVLLVIAHRIDTVLDCDRLLVLSAGRLVEQGTPSQLAAIPNGYFGRMVAAARVAAHGDGQCVSSPGLLRRVRGSDAGWMIGGAGL